MQLFDWLDNHNGYAIVADYLHTRPISINVMGRAPDTTSCTTARRVSLGTAEQIVIDAIELGDIGFRGGVTCTRAVSDLLAGSHKTLSPQAIAGLLSTIGYIKHPALLASDGRVTITGTRHRVYVDTNHAVAMSLQTLDAVADYWARSQTEEDLK